MKKNFTKVSISIYILFALIVTLVIAYFYVSNNNEKAEKSAGDAVSYVLQARIANGEFDYETADKLYAKAYNLEPYNSNIMEEYLLFAIMQLDKEKSFQLAQKVVTKVQNHSLASMVLVATEISNDRIDAAIENLSSIDSEKLSLNDLMLNVLRGLKAYKEGNIQTFESLNQEIKIINPRFYLYEKALFSQLSGDYSSSLEQLYDFNNYYPSVESVLSYTKLLYKQDQKAAADYFNDYLSDNFLGAKKIEQYLKLEQKLTIATVMSDLIIAISEMMSEDVNTTYLYSDKSALVSIALMFNPNNNRAILDLGRFYEHVGNYKRAIELYKSIPYDSYYSRLVTQDVVDIYRELGKTKEALKFLGISFARDKENAKLLLEAGLIQHKEGKHKRAISSYSDSLDISIKNNYKLGIWLSHFFMGITYDKMGDWENAELNLLEANSINSSDLLLTNYLAYSWLNRDYNVEKSIKMLENALKIDPNNPNLLDSYAWGLFKQNKYTEALAYSEKAVNTLVDDSVVVSHFADILWQLGYKKDAIANWKRVLNINPEESLKLETLAKLEGNYPSYLNGAVQEKGDYISFVERVKNSG